MTRPGKLNSLGQVMFMAGLILATGYLFSGCAGTCLRSNAGSAEVPTLTKSEIAVNLESFDYIWQTIADKHWEAAPGGLDWQQVRSDYRPRAAAATTMGAFRGIVNEMIALIGQSHFAVFPAHVYQDASSPEDETSASNRGNSGIDLRVVDGRALVVDVWTGSPGEMAGVQPGWILLNAKNQSIDEKIQRLLLELPDNSSRGYMLARAAGAELRGTVGDSIPTVFLNATDDTVRTQVFLASQRGNLSRFGNMPDHFVWHESRLLPGNVGYFRFSMFMDLVHVAPAFNQAIQEYSQARGMIIDLRGNPGGIGAMAMGMAGWFIPEKGHILGTMHSRNGDLKFAVTPRFPSYGGPLAILIDDMSASTSEILAGGLQDLGRARVFGSRSAGAALPSYIEKLPNGDGFQYAVANYVSSSGAVLEGQGITPDEVVALNPAAFTNNPDPILQAAMAWITHSQ